MSVEPPSQTLEMEVEDGGHQLATERMVQLLCAVVVGGGGGGGGIKGSVFPVEIDERQLVGDLKKAIKAEKPNDLKTIDADRLQLYVATKGDGAWLSDEDPAVVAALEKDGRLPGDIQAVIDDGGNVMPATKTLRHWLFDRCRMPPPAAEQIHVLVVVPAAAGAARPTKEELRKRQVESVWTEPLDWLPKGKRRRAEAVPPEQLRELLAVVQELEKADKRKVGTLLQTPTAIFGTAFDNGLYIRQEYWDLYGIITRRLQSDGSLCRVVVVGTPGIGKSVFGVFLLLLFMMEKKDVAYRPLGDNVIYFTHSSDGYASSLVPHADRTYDGIFDGNEAGEPLRLRSFDRAFLFASPRTVNYNEFVKTKCFKVYMNPWTKAECQNFANAMKLEDQDEWFRRFNLVGGIPRFVFPSAQTLSSQTLSSETFDDLVQRVKEDIPHNLDELKDQVRLFQQKVFDDRMKHIVFHLYRNEDAPSRAYLRYSSLVVEAIIKARYQAGSADQFRALLQTPAPNLHAWKGKEIEKFLLQELATSTFCMRALEGGSVGTVTRHGPLNAASVVIQASSEIQDELVLYIPLSKTFPAIDGVLVVPQDDLIIYAQSTVATAHPIKYQQLENVYKHLMQRQEFQGYTHILLFIVSNEIYDGFTVQTYKDMNGNKLTARIGINVTQYVGKITS